MCPKKRKIGLIGGGRGFDAVCTSLQDYFDTIFICTDVTVKRINSANCELIYVESPADIEASFCLAVGYTKIIHPKNGTTYMNLHPSLLPKYRGRHSVVWAMLDGEDYVGQTLHLLSDIVDGGDVVSQYKVKVGTKTSKCIFDELDQFNRENIGAIVSAFISGQVISYPQNGHNALYKPMRRVDDLYIKPFHSNSYIKRLCKALVPPYPYPRVQIGNKTYEVLSINAFFEHTDCEEVYPKPANKHEVIFATEDGWCIIDKIIELECTK